MSDANNQTGFEFSQDFDQLLEHLPAMADDRTKAAARYKEHLWALVCIIERRLQQQGIEGKQAYQLSCTIIAEIANYEGGECRYLPRGDRLKQELRDMHMFNLWHLKSWPVERVRKEYCPELNQIQVYKILSTKRQEHLAKIQPKLL
jgi:Mor family transcriptional regulator